MSMPDGRSVAGGANVAIPAPIIIITHFVNPHRLWFKYETCVRNGNAELEQLEQDLERHALKMGKLRLHLKGYQPERGEHVAIKHLTWNKWIRARVDAIDVVCGEGPKFVVWATDHGYGNCLGVRNKLQWIIQTFTHFTAYLWKRNPLGCDRCPKNWPNVKLCPYSKLALPTLFRPRNALTTLT